MSTKPKSLWRWLLYAVVLVVASAGVAYSGALWRVTRIPLDEGRSADAAIILGGYTARGVPSADFAARIRHGVELYQTGRVRQLIFAGCATPGEPCTTAAAGRDLAVSLGVPASVILVEPDSRTTFENLVFVKAMLADAGVRRVVVVTSDLHLARAMRMAADLQLDASPSASPGPALGDRGAFARQEARLYLKYLCYSRFLRLPTPEEARQGRHRVG